MDYPLSVPGVGLVGGQFSDGNPSLGQPASLDPASWANNVTEEMLNVIRAASLAPDETKQDQLFQAIRLLGGTVLTKAVAASNVTLTAAESRNPIILLTGTLAANINIIVPEAGREWVFVNNTTGAFTITVKTAAAAGIAVAQGASQHLICDGTQVLAVLSAQPPVQRSFKNSGFPISANITLTTNQAGLWFQVNGAGVTVTLPDADTAVGLSYPFRAVTAFTLTAVAGSVGGSGSISIAAGEWIEIAANAVVGGGWYIVGRGSLATPIIAADVAAAGVLAAPPGVVDHFAMNAAPSGWLKANGALISRTTYAALFAAIGTTFGVGDGSTTFALPDLRGEFVRGWDNGRGVDTGRTLGSAQADDFKSHTHTAFTNNAISGASTSGYIGSPIATNTGATGGTETRPRNIALLACIKY